METSKKIDLSVFDSKDIISADNLSDFSSNTSAKARILNYLAEVQKLPVPDGKPVWVSVKVIAQGANVSNIYTRNCLAVLVEEKKIILGKDGKKAFYRLAPVEGKKDAEPVH